ncbi:hypothetical protein FOA52_013986 [Chlamydomonas sp. UWO 241]|nr:hypothetical protein FOA52_013986 [Chlamydomonas sp. UWO 241]
MSQSPAVLVSTFLVSLGEQAPDEYVIDYVAGALSLDAEDAGESLIEELDEAVAALCPLYGDLDEGERLEALSGLYKQVQDCQRAKAAGAAAAAAAAAAAGGSTCGGRAASASSSGGVTSESGASAKLGDADEAQVESLLSLCSSQISREFAAHVLLHECNGDLQAAADYVLECGDLRGAEDAFERAQVEAAERRRLDAGQAERNRQAIIARFALQEVKDPSAPNGKKGGAITTSLFPQKAEQAPKYRYVGGVAVSVKKGQKYIVEKVGEEWDGGSKGKVNTKGKRGKGFA